MLLYGEELRRQGHLATWLSGDVNTWSGAEGSEPRVAMCEPEKLRQILQRDPPPTISDLQEVLGWPVDGGRKRKR